MKRPRKVHPQRGPRPPDRLARSWVLFQRIERLEAENRELRRAVRDVVSWYDTFDRPEHHGGVEPDLTEADFERFRALSRGSLHVVDGGR